MLADPSPLVSPTGLSSSEAAKRLAAYGPNEPVAAKRYSAPREFLAGFASPLIFILLVAAFISLALGQRTDSVLIIAMVLVGVIFNFVRAHQSQKAVEKLRAQVAATALVLRDGAWTNVRRVDVVPGDIVQLCAGDLVPADARLLTARDLHLLESALTGESLPTEKAPGPAAEGAVFQGTSVVSGTATAEVTSTGSRTAFGEIALRLASPRRETEFDASLRRFSYLIVRITVVLVLFIILIRLAFHQDTFQSFLFAVALAVGLTPEFLPMISSVTLARGATRMAKEGVIVRHLPSIQNLGAMDVLCSDKTGTLTSGQMDMECSLSPIGEPSDRPFALAYWNSKFETGVNSPLDAAILKRAAPPGAWKKLDEIPFDFERRRLSVVMHSNDECLLVTKGAPESILAVCTDFGYGATASTCAAIYEDLSRQGKRVLGVAIKSVDPGGSYRAKDEHSLSFVGFLVFSDPILPEAAEALRDLKRDGVDVKILTGDSHLVALNLCGQLGFVEPGILLGDQIEKMTDRALAHAAEQNSIFARVSPAQKNRIILALRHRGHVVGFMGDGINDAPSLRGADVGISVAGAVDVAREAADMVLTKPGLQVLHAGILEGRRAFGNVLKYLLMGTSSNFGNMFSMALASGILPFLPMLPTQILLNNFLYDLAQITIPTDEVDPEILRAPRRLDIHLVTNFMLTVGPVSSLFDFLTFYVLLHLFHAGEKLFHTGWFVESLLSQTLILFVIRTLGNPLKSRPSRPLVLSILAIAVVGLMLPYSPAASELGLTALPLHSLVFILAIVAAYMVAVNLIKKWLFGKEFRTGAAPTPFPGF